MDCKKIIMNFTTPPSLEDLEAMARDAIESLPAELASFCENIEIRVDDFADDLALESAEVEDPYELLAVFRNGNEIAPGIEKKVSNDDDVLILYRLPLLDLWCETGEDLGAIVRQTMISEIAQTFDFSEDEIEDMTRRALL